jgi:hypothetical protein
MHVFWFLSVSGVIRAKGIYKLDGFMKAIIIEFTTVKMIPPGIRRLCKSTILTLHMQMWT